LTAWCRPGESVGRIGGDEFVAAIDAGSDLQARLDALRTALHQPVTAGDRCLPLAASIGVAQVAGLPGRDLSTALTAADADMYSAKGRSRRGRHAGGLLLHLVNRAA
jgi:diguanylate cyclase (GGDEF)-like protein